jgi:AcrR family transcriptional regulator
MEKKKGVRERVIDAGIDLFAAQGYDATSVSDLISKAGTAKGGFYHHFESKARLLEEIYGALLTEQVADMKGIVAEKAPVAETLRRIIVNVTVSTATKGERSIVIWREMHRLTEAKTSEIRQARREYHETVVALIRKGQRSGEFRKIASPEMVTLAIFGVIQEIPMWYRSNGRRKPEEIGSELADIFLGALQKESD